MSVRSTREVLMTKVIHFLKHDEVAAYMFEGIAALEFRVMKLSGFVFSSSSLTPSHV